MILPYENESDVRDDLNEEQLGDLRVHYVRSVSEVIDIALAPKKGVRKKAAKKKAARRRRSRSPTMTGSATRSWTTPVSR